MSDVVIVRLRERFIEKFAELALTNPLIDSVSPEDLQRIDQVLRFLIKDHISDILPIVFGSLITLLWTRSHTEAHQCILFL